MVLKKCNNLLLLFFFSPLMGVSQNHDNLHGQKQLFNDNWKFAREEFKDASVIKFDDSKWQSVTLPHDWAIAGPFAEEFGPRSGGLPIYGIGWYRKHFIVPAIEKGKQVDFIYLENPQAIKHIDEARGGVTVFQAATLQKEEKVITNGGRVLTVSALAGSLPEALELCVETLDQIHFEGMYYRPDIGYEFVD